MLTLFDNVPLEINNRAKHETMMTAILRSINQNTKSIISLVDVFLLRSTKQQNAKYQIFVGSVMTTLSTTV